MVWTAALYLTASPKNASSSPMCVLAVLHAASPKAADAAMSRRLEDMAIVLFKAHGLVLRHAAGRRIGRPRWRRQRRWRSDKGPGRRRDTCVGAPIEQQIGLVRRSDTISRCLERSCARRLDQPRSYDDHQFRLFILE